VKLFPSGPVVLALSLACGGGGTGGDAASPADAPVSGSDGAPADATPSVDQSAGGSVDSGGVLEADAQAPPFVAIVPCPQPGNYVTGSGAITISGNAYVPTCLRVPAGTSVTIEASGAHPLEPRPGGSPGNPIRGQTATAPVVFSNTGFYPFECVEHVDQGMVGVIWVTPP